MCYAACLSIFAFLCCAVLCAAEGERVGQRPYELDWANRTADDHPPLVDFEDLDGWRVECQHAEAKFERTREQQLWGQHVGKLTYRATGPNPVVKVLPPAPLNIQAPFDAVTCWIYGNNWAYARNPETPPVNVAALFADAAGAEISVPLAYVQWEEWHLCHKRLAPDQMARVAKGSVFKGFVVTGGRNTKDRALYFDNLAVFVEEFKPLTFQPRPERGIPMFPGQSAGTNTGPGKLPFPTRPETILPDNLTDTFKTSVAKDGDAFVFTYAGEDGKLTFRIEPKTGTFSDITVQWDGRGGAIRPCVGGGVQLAGAGKAVAPEQAEHLGTAQKGDTVESRWRLKAGGASVEATFTYRLWKKSLVVDVVALGGNVAEVRYGRAVGLEHPRLVTLPFYLYGSTRPAIVVAGPPDKPLFLAGHTDWCLTNCSEPWAANVIDADGVAYNGGTRYIPKTDGKRNDCFERFFITLSPRFEEVLPNVPNTVSPWKHITGTRVWRAHGAGNRDHDRRYWTECHRYGMTQVIVTDHETMWRDGGESFTFRTRAAPKKGGDEGAREYSRFMQDTLGFVYGPYNNFTDFAPVNEFWSADLISRSSDNQLQHAWMRCYAPKPARAVEYCALLAPKIQEKFRFSTAYCDVHTAVAPWHRTDYDARVPGAGTCAAVFYSFGEIMLHQKAAWNGPVYSEGNNHFSYCGLTDGNYGQDQNYRPATQPWLVDFDLRKLHDLCCNFGMGNPEMFFAGQSKHEPLDRFFAATVAFGHPGFLTYEGGLPTALRSYYLLQPLHARYTQASVKDIRYVDADGKLLDTTAAVATGAYARSQVVTRYADGTITAANGHTQERMVVAAYGRKLDLPPNSYAGWTADGAVDVFSGDVRGQRCDYAVAPTHIFVDGRGRFVRFAKAAGNGIGICRVFPGGYEIIPVQGAECGFAVRAGSAVALSKEGKDIGAARLRVSRGLTYVEPVANAFSYRLSDETMAAAAVQLKCERDEVVPGESVVVRGKEEHTLQIPADAKPGARVWRELEGGWIDFTVVALADVDWAIAGDTLRLALTSHLAKAADATLTLRKQEQRVRLDPGVSVAATFDLGAPAYEGEELLALVLRAGETETWLERGLRTELGLRQLAALPDKWRAGMRLRKQDERGDFGETRASVDPRASTCGGVERSGIFMHPPWMGGTGYSFALYDPLTLPAAPGAAFRALVGKGDGSDLGDGILYKVSVVDPNGVETTVAEQTVAKHEWLPIEADLTPWAGKPVRLKLITDAGPKDNSSGDWGCWAEMRLQSRQPQLTRTLDENVEPYRREPGPFPVAGVTVEQLRSAKRGWLRYDGMGLEGGTGEYGSSAVLNGVELGAMAPAGGDEVNGVWAERTGVPLTPEAIKTLGFFNRFALRNPRKDHFKVRRFWIELELADDRKCSSLITPAVFTQPPGWKYEEGIKVPLGEDIRVGISFGR